MLQIFDHRYQIVARGLLFGSRLSSRVRGCICVSGLPVFLVYSWLSHGAFGISRTSTANEQETTSQRQGKGSPSGWNHNDLRSREGYGSIVLIFGKVCRQLL